MHDWVDRCRDNSQEKHSCGYNCLWRNYLNMKFVRRRNFDVVVMQYRMANNFVNIGDTCWSITISTEQWSQTGRVGSGQIARVTFRVGSRIASAQIYSGRIGSDLFGSLVGSGWTFRVSTRPVETTYSKCTVLVKGLTYIFSSFI